MSAFSSAQRIVVRGREEVAAAFLSVRRDVLTGLRPALRAAGEPVRRDAESLSVSNIRNIGPTWSQMRLGASVASGVYLAPRARNTGGPPRPNLRGLLETQMVEARDQHQEDFVAALDLLVDASAASAGWF